MQKPTLIFVTDPLCGWCFAMSPAVEFARRELANEFDFKLSFGNLFEGERAKVMGAGFLEHLEKGTALVEQLSPARFGQRFREIIMTNPNYVYETTMGTKAIRAIMQSSNANPFELAAKIGDLFFVEGESANEVSNFMKIALEYGLSHSQFLQNFYSSELTNQMKMEYAESRRLMETVDSKSLPTFILRKENIFVKFNHEIARFPEDLVASLRKIIKT